MNRSLHLVAAVVCISFAASTDGAEATPTKDKLAIYAGAAVIDGRGGPVRPDMAVITRGERIEAIVPQAELTIPPGAEVIDVNGQFALPGFINSHEHLATPPAPTASLLQTILTPRCKVRSKSSFAKSV